MAEMRILVAGAGAVGGFVAARLAEAGQDVTVLARPRRAERLREDGLRLAGVGVADGTHTVQVPVLTAAELAPGYDAVLIAVKADALDQVLKDIAPAVGPTSSAPCGPRGCSSPASGRSRR